jgi:hypothetical protein
VENSSQNLLAYGLVWCHRGTRLARLYSLAVSPERRGKGIAQQLLQQLEQETAQRGHFFMRLEVAKTNQAAIRLYENSGYHVFGEYSDYYEDHGDALRMQKKIQRVNTEQILRPTPWYQQSTEFTCGPAALMMAMASLDPSIVLDQKLELDLWREATTIYMTSGHGGCHPVGLGLAAQKRGFDASVYINTSDPLFIDGVRSEKKKRVIATVDRSFLEKAGQQKLRVIYADIDQALILKSLQAGHAILMLISTYRLDGRKTPHWVTVTSMDDLCLYVHDPDPDPQDQQALDCQHLPIAREDFEKMSIFGSSRLRTAVVLKPKK